MINFNDLVPFIIVFLGILVIVLTRILIILYCELKDLKEEYRMYKYKMEPNTVEDDWKKIKFKNF